MARKILMRHGLKNNLPQLDEAEWGFTTDDKIPFIGSNSGNIEIPTREYVDEKASIFIGNTSPTNTDIKLWVDTTILTSPILKYRGSDNLFVALSTNSTTINVKDNGAIGNGIADDTAAINAVLAANSDVYIPDGTYMINVNQSLIPKSNQTITLSANAILKAIPTNTETNAVIKIDGVNHVTITGGNIVGERHTHTGTTGEWGMGISIVNGAANISVSDITISDCWGDGIYVGGSIAQSSVSSILIDNVVSDGNRRQGLSATNVSTMTISDSIFKNTLGTDPAAGIDLEPNTDQLVQDVMIINCQCFNNNSYGLLLNSSYGVIKGITLTNGTIYNNLAGDIATRWGGTPADTTEGGQETPVIYNHYWLGD